MFPGAGKKYSISSYAKDGSFAMIQGYTIFGLEKSSLGFNISDDFSKPKICYSETNNAKATKITFDTQGFYTDKTCFVLITDNNTLKHIYNILSSKIFTWYMYNTSPLLGEDGISLTKDSVLKFPLCPLNSGYCLTDDEMNCISASLNL